MKRMWDKTTLIAIVEDHGGGSVSKNYVDNGDAETLSAAETYTDEATTGLAAMSEVEEAIEEAIGDGEIWTFTLADGSTVNKTVVIKGE